MRHESLMKWKSRASINGTATKTSDKKKAVNILARINQIVCKKAFQTGETRRNKTLRLTRYRLNKARQVKNRGDKEEQDAQDDTLRLNNTLRLNK